MSDYHFVAIPTYGKEEQDGVLSFNVGRGIGADVLLALFGSRARETTPPGAGDRYIHVNVQRVVIHHNWLVLRVTADEKMQVEAICRSLGHSSSICLWQRGEDPCWYEFPCSPQAHYIPQSHGGSHPKFAPTAAPFLTPSQPLDATEADANMGSLTAKQSGNWWWIGGETYPHKETLRAAGAQWSKRRQQWYFIGETLSESIQALVSAPSSEQSSASVPERKSGLPPIIEEVITESGIRIVKREVPLSVFAASAPRSAAPSPVAIEPTAQAASEPPEPAHDSSEVLMRSVRTDDVTAALVAHIHDSERSKPILIDFIGSRNAVKQLLSKPFNPAYVGVKAESAAFTIVDGDRYTSFRLPDFAYKALSTTLSGRVIEGRIVALDATTTAPRTECYVLVADKIELPKEPMAEPVEETWLRYVHYRQTPNRPEFAHYTPPAWAPDLYNVYQALRTRIGRPLHERWMPWLFAQVADKPVSSEKLDLKGVTLCKYIPGYIAPKAEGVVERGVYRLTCRDLSDLWAELLIRNPNRADGITFGKAE
ncbi:MAG: hypothetical protein ACYDBJ_07200 [Aggregatilineales bacterium]